MNREEAVLLIKEHVKGDFLFKHMLATEAIMREVAGFLGEDAEMWAMAGLVHDIDFEETKDADISQHGVLADKYLAGKIPDEAMRAINNHSYFLRNAPEPTDKMSVVLLAADATTGLIVAAALVKPEKKLSAVTVDSVKNAFKKKGFAAGSNRENIKKIEGIGIPMDKFFALSLAAMQRIAPDLGL